MFVCVLVCNLYVHYSLCVSASTGVCVSHCMFALGWPLLRSLLYVRGKVGTSYPSLPLLAAAGAVEAEALGAVSLPLCVLYVYAGTHGLVCACVCGLCCVSMCLDVCMLCCFGCVCAGMYVCLACHSSRVALRAGEFPGRRP